MMSLSCVCWWLIVEGCRCVDHESVNICSQLSMRHMTVTHLESLGVTWSHSTCSDHDHFSQHLTLLLSLNFFIIFITLHYQLLSVSRSVLYACVVSAVSAVSLQLINTTASSSLHTPGQTVLNQSSELHQPPPPALSHWCITSQTLK